MLGIGEKHELPTVLLIDDDLVSREVIATVLTLHGHMVHTAETGDAAIEMLESRSLSSDVVLMDAQLPGLSGVNLIARLRELGQSEIILISGSAPDAASKGAADGFLMKPFSPEDLRRVLGEHAARPVAPTSQPVEPVINPETLAQFRQLMTESTVREIYVAAVSDLNKRIGALEKALAHGDHDEIRRIGHAIKGGCGMAGAMQAAHLGALLEAKSDQLDNCADALRELFSATERLKRMLEREFPG